MRGCYLGVDGGGTKTAFVLIDAAGQVLAEATGATTYHLQVGLEGVLAVLRAGIADVLRRAGVPATAIAHAFFGLPAYGEDSRIDGALARLPAAALGHDRYACGNDMICGWAGSLGCADGINVVAGTGSIAYGERQGRAARCGGWGEYFSDEGSGYWIAMQGLALFCRMSDGRAPQGPLLALLRDHFALAHDLDICGAVLGDGPPQRDRMAALALKVAEAADRGDAAAAAILTAAGDELAALAEALRRALGFAAEEPVPVSWSGSVFANPRVIARFRERLAAASPAYRLVPPRHPPALGAALYARHLALSLSAAPAIPPDT